MCGLSSRGNASEATGKFSPRARFATEATSSIGKRSRSAGCERNFHACLNLGQIQSIPDLDPTTPRFTRRQLESHLRPPRSSKPPGPYVRGHLPDLTVATEEDDINREPHEEHVNRRSRLEQQPLPGIEAASTQEPPRPRQGRIGNEAPLANDPTIHGPELDASHECRSRIAPRRSRRPAPPAGSGNSRPACLNKRRGLAGETRFPPRQYPMWMWS